MMQKRKIGIVVREIRKTNEVTMIAETTKCTYMCCVIDATGICSCIFRADNAEGTMTIN
jgi:hypothetical protein